MSTGFPTSLDSLTNPQATDKQNNPSHSAQHANANDAIEAMQAKLGVNGSAVTTSHDYKLSGITGSDKAASKTGSETLTNKTLTSPKINENVAVTSISSEINLLHGVTSSTTELNYVDVATPGTAEATKALVTDASKNINLGTGSLTSTDITSSGTLSLATMAGSWNGWIASGETWMYAGADSPTFTYTISGDKTAKYSQGMRIKFDQDQALTAYWDMNSNSNSQVGSFNGTDTNMSYTAGKFGNAATYNGTTSKIVIADNAILKPTGAFTVGCWFKTNNAGAFKMLFHSYSANTNGAGLYLGINASNVLQGTTGNNTASGGLSVLGTTTVTDNAWHYAVFSFQGNYGQVYLDGNLEASGFLNTPAYAATNYVRIGCYNASGSDLLFMNGQIDDVFLINGYALSEEAIKAQYTAQAAQGTGNITVNKKGIITKINYAAGTTTISAYFGTDYAIANATISNPYFSMIKAPFGLPVNPEKWTVIKANKTTYSQTSPTSNSWYNLNADLSLVIPIGAWDVSYQVGLAMTKTVAGGLAFQSTLSTANNSESDTSFTLRASNGNTIELTVPAYIKKFLNLTAKTTYYLNTRGQGVGGAGYEIFNLGALGATVIKAVNAYL